MYETRFTNSKHQQDEIIQGDTSFVYVYLT